jgi:hypothetical protein
MLWLNFQKAWMRKKHGGKRKWKPSTKYASPVDERTKSVRNGED